MTDPVPARIGPVPGDERITVIDCLRGWALFGILMANMRGFHAPMDAYMNLHYWAWLPDRVTQALVDWLISGKFITIFAALFGVGFAIQMDRAAARAGGLGNLYTGVRPGSDPTADFSTSRADSAFSFYNRRMAALLFIGLAHGLLIWWGDILTNYALCGFFLLLFRSKSQRSLLAWAQGLYWSIVFLFLAFYLAHTFGAAVSPDPTSAQELQATIQAYAHGTIREVFVTRAREWAAANAFFIFLTRILGIFLFGTYLWRQGYLRDPAAHREWWARAQRLGLAWGLAGNALAILLEWQFHASPEHVSGPAAIWIVVQSLAIPALSLGYVATIVRLWQNPTWQRRLLPFSYVGRMALTNYLLQSLICTTIFYSYGLGLYNRVGPLLDVWLAVVIYGLQIPFSRWWLSRHRYGPMEWVWRRLTYGDFRIHA